MHKNEIVVTKQFLDIGLCIGQSENGVPIIRSKYSPHNPNGVYGGVEHVKWLTTGVYCTEREWNKRTRDSMTVEDIIKVFGIDKRVVKPSACFVEPSIYFEKKSENQIYKENLVSFLQKTGLRKKKAEKIADALITAGFCVESKVIL